MLCPICSGDFQQPEGLCPDCGCGLVPASLDMSVDPEPIPDGSTELVELCRPRLFSLAMLIKQILEQNGVPAMVPGANAFSVMPHLAFSGEMRVMVSSNHLEYARQLYSAYFEGDNGADYHAEWRSDYDFDAECRDAGDAEYDGDAGSDGEYDDEEF